MSSSILNIDNKVNCRFCNQPLSILQISHHQKFCSRKCKSESQKQKIILICNFCGKKFSILPYLKRKSNYCSVKCYRDATRRKSKKNCIICGKEFEPKACLVKKGFGIYCSKKCQFSVYESKRKKLTCPRCKKEFWAPPSVAIRRKFCTKKCKDDFERDYVKRKCKDCKEYFFLPRWELNKGKGTFCSRKCFQDYSGETSIEALIRKALKKRGINFEQETKIGKYYADFLISNQELIIECDGEYWHRSVFAKNRDLGKDKFLTEKGYSVCRFTEKEIKESKGNCVEGLLTPYR